jgi:uncharacterized protein YhfF
MMLRNTAPETSMVIGPGARTLWRQYLQASSAAVDADQRFYEVFRIGDTEASATAGAEEILSGVKTATSALLFEYEASGRVPPTAGALSIVENGRRDPVCIVETTEVVILPFSEVDAGFARDYGEWDGSLATWQEQCWNYYSARCRQLGQEPSTDMLVVCERFRVVYP